MLKPFIFLVKSLLGNFYRHLATFFLSHWIQMNRAKFQGVILKRLLKCFAVLVQIFTWRNRLEFRCWTIHGFVRSPSHDGYSRLTTRLTTMRIIQQRLQPRKGLGKELPTSASVSVNMFININLIGIVINVCAIEETNSFKTLRPP